MLQQSPISMTFKLPTLGAVLVLAFGTIVTAQFPRNPISVTETSHNETTKGESGVVCSKLGRRCITGTTCVNKKCKCPEGQKGNAQIECVDEENLLCLVNADPHLISYPGAKADIDLPCRYRLTRYVTGHRAAHTQHSFCSVEVYATNELHKGYFYVRSMHISLGITDSGKQIHHQFEVRKFGVSDDEIYQFLANITKTQTLWGFSQHEVINGVDVIATFDKENNFAVLWVPECATRIKYRAYDRSQHRQRLLPGISIMAPPDSVWVDGYGYYPHSLCGTDKDDENLYDNRAHELGLKNKHLAVIHDVLLEAAPQSDNPKRYECEAAMATYKLSTNRVEDLNFCGATVTDVLTRKCILKAGYQPIEILTSCLKWRQDGFPEECSLLLTVRHQCGSQWNVPPIKC